MGILISLVMNFIVAAASFIITYKLFKINNFIDSLISWFIFYFAQVVITELMLGILGLLSLKNLILLNLAVLFIVWYIMRHREASFNFAAIKDSVQGLLSNRVALLAISVILGFGLVKLCINLVNPPFGWDDLNYHFTFPVEWLKHGNLDTPITVFDDPSPTYYPVNGSLYYLWLALPLKNVFLADLGQVPFFILGFLVVFNIARKLSLSRELSFYAAGLFLIIPNFFKQLSISYVDVMVAALFLAAVNFLFSLKEVFSFLNVFTFSISLGLLLGTKTVALPYSILLFAPFLYLYCKNLNKAKVLAFVLFAIIALGGFSYIRNFLNTGNPLYPLHLSLFGKVLFKGVMDNSVYRSHFRIEDYRLAKLLFHEGLGIQTLVFILPAVFLALPITLIKRRKGLDFNSLYFLILPVFIYLVYRYIIPLANTRYLYPLLGVGMVIAFYALKLLNIPRPLTKTLVVISILASMSELAKRQELVAGIIVTFLLFFAFRPFSKLIKGLIKEPRLFGAFLVFVISGLIFLNVDYNKNEYPRYIKMTKYSGFWPEAAKAWEWLNINTLNSNIAYAGRPVPFPLYGTNFKNNVYYVSVNKTEPAKLHYFKDSRYEWGYDFLSLHKNLEREGNYRGMADYAVWLNNLAKRKTDYLFVYSLHQTKEVIFPIEDMWAKNNPDRFSLEFSNGTIHIYKIIK